MQPKAKPQPKGEPQPASEAAPYLPSAAELALLAMTEDQLLAVFNKIVLDPDFWLLNKHHCDTPTGPSEFLRHLYQEGSHVRGRPR